MNKLTIIGNLTRDPELRTTQTGVNVCDFTVAVNRRQRRDQNSQQPEADFFRVTAWREQGENAAKYLAKGKKVCVVGPVSVRTYTGNDGVTRASLEVTADDIEYLTPRQDGQGGGYQNGSYQPQYQNAPPQYQNAPAPQYQGGYQGQYQQPTPGNQAPPQYQQPYAQQQQMPIAGAPASAVPQGFTAVETDDLPF